jgi:signal transduction histidine kinase/DNA-binding response OmpR family regulator/ligand-binding sensor domain-containing protein
MNTTTYAFELRFENIGRRDGLNNSCVTAITEDQQGYIWFSTHFGVNRYDGESIESFVHSDINPYSINSDEVENLFVTTNNHVLVVFDKGCDVFNYQKSHFKRIKKLNSKKVTNIIEYDCKIYFYTAENIIYEYDRDLKFIKYYTLNSEIFSGNEYEETKSFKYSDSLLYIVSKSNGIYFFDLNTKELTKISDFKFNIDLYRMNLLKINDSIVYISSYKHGLYKFINHKFEKKIKLEGSNKQIYISKLFRYNEDYMWVLTDGYGIVSVNLDSQSKIFINNRDINKNYFRYNNIRTIYRDKSSRIWIGTVHNGVEKQIKNVFKHISCKTNLFENVESPTVVALYVNNEGLWYCLDNSGVSFIDRKGNLTDIDLPFENKTVMSIYKYQDKLYLGTYNDGVYVYSNLTKKITKLGVVDLVTNSPHVNCITSNKNSELIICYDKFLRLKNHKVIEEIDLRCFSYYENKNGDEYIGASDGLYQLYKGELRRCVNCKNVFNIVKGNKSYLWISSSTGLYRYDSNTGNVKNYSTSEGLRTNNLMSLTNDLDGNLWMGTVSGLSFFDTQVHRFKNYNNINNGGVAEFYRSCVFNGNNGQLYFGGINGITHFDPKDIMKLSPNRDVKFNKLTIYSHENKNIEQNLFYKEDSIICIESSKKVFEINYSCFDYSYSHTINYKYKLDGLDEHFRYTNKSSLRFMNLQPGNYKLMIQASTPIGEWTNKYSYLYIVVLPLWWQTIWFKCLVFIFICLLFFILYYNLRRREILKNKYDKEKFIREEQQKSSENQLNFYSNLSHELRTPLTLIMSPVEELLKHKQDSITEKYLNFVIRNTSRMKKQIDRAIDFRRLKFKEPTPKLAKQNISLFIKDISSTFETLAEAKSVKFEYQPKSMGIRMVYDEYMIETIIYNLLTNAFKYTNQGDSVELKLDETDSEVVVTVLDSGIGITESEIQNIYSNFYQINDSVDGMGIGLALTKKFVEAHNGKINVESVYGEYTKFTLKFSKVKNKDFKEEYSNKYQLTKEEELFDIKKYQSKSLLIVDDEVDILEYLNLVLKDKFKILLASDGLEAKEIIENNEVDLVITDINMPRMDGIDLLKFIKSDENKIHIPCILLTSKINNKYKSKAYGAGADAFVDKPFSIDLLLNVINNSFRKFEQTQKELYKKLNISNEIESKNDSDEFFISRFIEIVEQNISNFSLSPSIIAKEIGVSRTILYNRIKEIKSLGVNEYILEIRFKHATYLLENSEKSINEISDSVGFKSPKYFSTKFKTKYKQTPTDYKKKVTNLS